MFWIITTLLALGGFVASQFVWARRLRAAEQTCRTRMEAITRSGQEARLQAQAQQEAVFNSMVEGVVLLDSTARIQLANKQFNALFGVYQDARGKTLLEATRMHELADLMGGLGADSPVRGREIRIPALDERWLNVSAAAVLGPGGGRTGSVLVFHDLTRLKRLERTREEFVANVSHELRTPLSLIQGYVETLLGGTYEDPVLAHKFLQIIERNSERLKLLIEDLLIISELESGRIRMQLQPVALAPLAAKLCDDFRPRAEARETELRNEFPDLQVRADPNRLLQVFSNLLDNAIKYGRKHGTVTLRARVAPEGRVEVCVMDDGPGIAAEARDRVFERFYRVDKGRSREQGGTGLGLSIVKHIVQSHGGRVWLESEPGAGSRFWFSLPVVQVESRPNGADNEPVM